MNISPHARYFCFHQSPELSNKESVIPEQEKCQSIWQFTLRNGQTLALTYSKEQMKISISVLKNGRLILIKPDNLPSALKSVHEVKKLHWILTHSYAKVIFLNNHEPKLNFGGRLRGGASCQEVLNLLRQHLAELKNPIVVNMILEKFRLKCSGLIDLTLGVEGWLDDLCVPPETKQLLDVLDEAIKNKARNLGREELDKLRSELNHLLSNPLPDYVSENLPDELLVLLNMPQIQSLNTAAFNQLYSEIHSEHTNTDELKNLLESFLTEDQQDEINAELFERDLNLYTVLDEARRQVIKKKAAPVTSIVTYRKEKVDFFINKTIDLQDPINFNTHSGVISKIEKKKGMFKFYLHGGILVTITSDYRVKIQEIVRYPLIKAFIEEKIKEGDRFTLKNQSEGVGLPLTTDEYLVTRIDVRNDGGGTRRMTIRGEYNHRYALKIKSKSDLRGLFTLEDIHSLAVFEPKNCVPKSKKSKVS